MIAPWALKESITRVDKLATLIIVAGVVLSTAFGSHNSVAWSMSELLELFKEPLFIIVTAGLWCLGDHRLERFSAA